MYLMFIELFVLFQVTLNLKIIEKNVYLWLRNSIKTAKLFLPIHLLGLAHICTIIPTIQLLHGILEIINSKIGLLHVLMYTAKIVVIMREHPVSRQLGPAVQHFDRFSVVFALVLDVGADKFTGNALATRQRYSL